MDAAIPIIQIITGEASIAEGLAVIQQEQQAEFITARPPFESATPFDCIVPALEELQARGVTEVRIIASLCGVHWRELVNQIAKAYPTITPHIELPDTRII